MELENIVANTVLLKAREGSSNVWVFVSPQTVLRRPWSWWSEANSFHVCLTSYKLLLKDHGHFMRRKISQSVSLCQEDYEVAPDEKRKSRGDEIIKKALHDYLSGDPFSEYQSSMHFDRFLQWKMLER
ncbi:hypothetical protein CRUP_010926 [Coryphaenoides rupestris]|nr:hypothetical protein CRUP_010926 [Coryphaenoides rupestris]